MKKSPTRKAELPSAPLVTHKEPAAPRGGNFFDTVFRIARKIPRGRVTSYGAIAERLQRQPPETEFEQGVRRFGALLVEVTLLLVLAIWG